ncbi:MAG: 3'-5' exoribonuclease [Actinomycetales bacterium]|nr:3'-5' exoribonuclease [Actinomycetales bacterium]
MLDIGYLTTGKYSKRSILDTTLVVVDLETTGFSPKSAGITEIGAVKIHGTEVLGEFQTFVNPGVSIPSRISQITGITQAHVQDAPSTAEALQGFLDFAQFGPTDDDFAGAVVVAHNASFDLGFLTHYCLEHGITWPLPRRLDTVSYAKRMLNGATPNLQLETLANHFKVSVPPIHRALDDAKATTEVLWNLIRLAQQGR